MAAKKRIFSGMQPTGVLHLGSYYGALVNWVRLQDEYECVYCIVDQHALTVDYEPAALQERVLILPACTWRRGSTPEIDRLRAIPGARAHRAGLVLQHDSLPGAP